MQFLARIPTWAYVAAGAALVAAQILILYLFGQPFISLTGHMLLWVNNPAGPDSSQQLADWYSFSHIIHGFLFYWLLTWLFPRAPLGARVLGAMGLEISWELLENTPMVIHAYRAQALARGYSGDSILNSVSDTCMMLIGFLLASRIKARFIATLAIAFEIFTGYMIHDGLALNILNFAYQVPAVHEWQASPSPARPL